MSTLNSTATQLGDSVSTLRDLLLNMKPGGSEDDLAELRERVDVMSGRVDAQMREVTVLSHASKQHAASIDGLETSTSALQALMPTKADITDLASKADRATVDRHEQELTDLSVLVKQDHEPRLKILESGLKRLSQAVETLANDEFKHEAVQRITDLENQVKMLTEQGVEHATRLTAHDEGLATKSEQTYVDSELEALLAKLRELELALAQSMKGELKRFERDVMIYVADQLTNAQPAAGAGGGAGGSGHSSGSHHAHSNTAAGKFHYRCLTCDQPKENVPGPATYRYNKSMGSAVASPTIGASESRLLEMQLGDQIYLHGTDGGIYKGRTEPAGVPAIAPSAELLRLQSPGQASARGGGSPMRSRPQSADPSRASFGRQQIDPQSGRKSGELFAMPLPLGGLAAAAAGDFDSKEQDGTARTLFPSPGKTARASGGSTSRAALGGGGASGMLKSTSSSALGLGQVRSRPSTATARSSTPSAADGGGGHVLVAKTQPDAPRTIKSRNGVEIVQDIE